ncbi:MAG: hypothetical protein GX915_00160 [Clostridiales bacterium]|nr:hypothetical protein [Clostridiales bacterium]
MGGIIAIYDSDLTYAIRLMEYIKKRKEFGYEVLVFTKENSLYDFVSTRVIDILLMEDGLLISNEMKDNIKATFILSDDLDQSATNEELRVLKYQSAQKLITDVLLMYNRLFNKDQQTYGNKSLKIVSVISLTPEINKLAFAWSYAYHISEHHKVLFIPLELLPIPFIDMNEHSKSSLSDFLYYLKNKDSNLISIMNSYISNIDSIAYLSGISIGLDLISVTKEDIKQWIEALSLNTEYDVIIFYLGFYSEAAVELIKQSTEVLVPIVEQSEDHQVIRELERQLDFIGVSKSPEKVYKVNVPLTKWSADSAIKIQELKHSGAWKASVKLIEGDPYE